MKQVDSHDGLLTFALQLKRLNRCRLSIFGIHSGLFRDPAWDMLIEAFVADRTSTRMYVKALIAAAGVPSTTALRWIKQIENAGFVIRIKSEDDRRVTIVALTDLGRRFVSDYLLQAERLVAAQK